MSFALKASHKCPTPPDFSKYYSLDSLKQANTSICGNLGQSLPGLTQTTYKELDTKQQTGGNSIGRVGYTAAGELGILNCNCNQNNQSGGNNQLCKVYPINDSLISQGPALALHAEPIGQRPVVSTQDNRMQGQSQDQSQSQSQGQKSMLDRQFDCFQPFWSEKCD